MVLAAIRTIRKAGFDRGVPVDNWPDVLGYPAAETGPHRDCERRQEAEVIPADKFGEQQIALADEGDNGIVRHQFAQPHRNQG